MKTISDLRRELFQSIQDLRDKKITLAEAKQIASTAQTIINASKVEVDFLKQVKRDESLFFPKTIESIDKTLREIEEANKEPYKTG